MYAMLYQIYEVRESAFEREIKNHRANNLAVNIFIEIEMTNRSQSVITLQSPRVPSLPGVAEGEGVV